MPIEITYRNFEPTVAMEQDLRRHAKRLDRYCGDIMSCRILIECPHRHRKQGRHYHVRIDLHVPGKELVVNRNPTEHAAHEDLHVAIRDAFRACRRELQDYARVRRRQVKTPAGSARGRIASLSHYEGFGYLDDEEGRPIWFDQRSVLQADFAALEVGDWVRFAEEIGDKGPQASSVIPDLAHRRRKARRAG